MAFSAALILLLSACFTRAEYSQLIWSDCGSDPSITIRQIDATPMPVVMPGPLRLTIEGQLDRTLSDIEIELDIKRRTRFFDLPVPCLFDIGSCTYEYSCSASGDLLERMIREDWAGIMGTIGSQIKTMLNSMPGFNSSTCPPAQAPVGINIQRYLLNLPEASSLISSLIEGDYRVRLTTRDKGTGKTHLCLNLELSVQKKREPCRGFFCGK